jgi:hypothetical protein
MEMMCGAAQVSVRRRSFSPLTMAMIVTIATQAFCR